MRDFKFQISSKQAASIILLAVIFFIGCTGKSEPANTRDTDKTSMRIISMAPNLTEILFTLGLNEEVVGVTKFSTYPKEAKSKTNVGSFWQPDIEAVLMCKPTLVITLGFSQQTSLADRLKEIGCKTLTVNIGTIDELYEAIRIIGSEVDRCEQAARLIEQLQNQQDTLSNKYTGRSDRPKVLWVVQREPLRVAGTRTFVNELIEIAGGVNAIGETVNVYPPISNEELIGSMPDVIIEPAMDMNDYNEQKEDAARFYQRFSTVPAVRHGRIYVINGDLVSRLGPRLDRGMELVAGCLWPEKIE